VLDDIASLTLQTAVAGLSTRQQVTSNNIANVETPNYIASTVSFEDSLASAVADGDPTSAEFTTSPVGLTPGINGNNVNLSDEIVTATKTGLQESLLTGAINSKYGLISDVLKG
jgi:flagellar basal-body rod protein FlgB